METGKQPKGIHRENLRALLNRFSLRLQDLEALRRDLAIQLEKLRQIVDEVFGPDVTQDKMQTGHKICDIKGRMVELPQALANLFEVLKAASGTWITAEHLSLKLGKSVTDRTRGGISQLVYRLRKQLMRAEVDPQIIERRRRRGYRLKSTDRG